jgi:hypothetical protein
VAIIPEASHLNILASYKKVQRTEIFVERLMPKMEKVQRTEIFIDTEFRFWPF